MRAGLALLATVVVAAGCGGGGGDGDGEWLAGYRHRKRIDLHPPSRAALDDFPVAIITASDPELAAGAQADGSDIVIADGDGKVPPFELETFVAGSGRLALWVRIERLAGPTSLWLYYGGDTYPAAPAVLWPAKFAAVWHLGTAAEGASPESTASGHDLVQGDPMRVPSETTGIAGGARGFDGIDDMLELAAIAGTALQPGTASFSFCLWANPSNNLDGYDTALYVGSEQPVDPGYDVELGTEDWRGTIADGTDAAGAYGIGNGALLLGRWSQLCTVVDREHHLLYGYGNGAPRDQVDITAIGAVDHAGPLTVGSLAGAHPFLGELDEIRVYSVALPPEWIEAEYVNLIDPAAFFTLGPEEDAP